MVTTTLPRPVLFHPLKHHLGFIRAFIQEQAMLATANPGPALQRIGTSQLDFYTGPLTPLEIAQAVILQLEQQDLLHPEAYRQFLAAHRSHYRTITLPDGTDWILRWGTQEGRYVHLHPARYAAQTIRVKAASLKTAIAATIAARQQHTTIDLPLVNKVRAEQLHLPPLTVLQQTEGAGKLLALLQR
ncbi:hypothetical protein H7F15_10790 [Pontibacter sp. Tf4]|nr:hypothetical protein [Pontibacter sp. Tf4]